MFEDALKGTKGSKGVKKLKTFGRKDAERWKKEGSVSNIMKLKKSKAK